MSARIEGEKAIVVGAGQPRHHLLGNGRAIATMLAREGAEVCAVDRDKDRAEETVARSLADGGLAHSVTADVSDLDDCARLVAESRTTMGPLDVLVNNAGVSYCDAGPLDLEPEPWQEIMDINLRGIWLVSKAAVPLMKEQGGGAIANISTAGARTGGGTLFAYSISKSGVNALTHFFAVEYAQFGIRCNAVLPAFIATPHLMGVSCMRASWPPRTRLLSTAVEGRRSDAPAPPRTSQTQCCSCPRTSPASSRVWRYRSTAGCWQSLDATSGPRRRRPGK